MTTIQTMCNYILDCFSAVTNQIRHLFGYPADDGYQLIEPSHTQTPSSSSIRGDDSCDPKPLKIKDEKSVGKGNNLPLIAINEMSENPKGGGVGDSDSNKKEEVKKEGLQVKKTGSVKKEKNMEGIVRSVSEATGTDPVISERPVGDIKSAGNSSGFSSTIDLDSQPKEPIDVSKINLFKINDSKTQLSENSDSSKEKFETRSTPKIIPPIFEKQQKSSDSKEEDENQSHPTRRKIGEDNEKPAPKPNMFEKKRPASTINKSASEKISKLAGNLGKINLAGLGPGGRPPFPMARPVSVIDKPPVEESPETSGVQSVTNILKSRVQSMNKRRRPPSMNFIKTTLGTPNRSSQITASDETSETDPSISTKSEISTDPQQEESVIKTDVPTDVQTEGQTEGQTEEESEPAKREESEIKAEVDESLGKLVTETKSGSITPNPSLSSSVENLNESKSVSESKPEEETQKKAPIEEESTDSAKTESVNDQSAVSSKISGKSGNMGGSMQSITRDENDTTDLVFESALDISANKSYNPSDGTNVNNNQPFVTVVGEDFLSAQNLSSKSETKEN